MFLKKPAKLQITFKGKTLVLKKHSCIGREGGLNFSADVSYKALFITKHKSPILKVTTPESGILSTPPN